jgi:GT2 family glycosyltransferase
MDLSIIVVNWNSKEYLRKCLASAFAQTEGLEFETIVIDAGSHDGCEKMLEEFYPGVRFIQTERNLGFAKANNLAFEISSGRCVLFLNPDTELQGPAADVLYHSLQALPEAGVIGAKLLNSDGTLQTSCIKAFPNLLNQFIEAEALRKIFPRARLWGMRPLFENSETAVEVDVVSGACMIMRRTVFERIGGFTSRYFMYSEDVDLCLKTKKAGLKNYYVPGAVVLHHGGGCTSENTPSTFSSVMAVESRWRFFVSTKSNWYGWSYRVLTGLVSVFRIGVALVLLAMSTRRSNAKRWSAVMEKSCARLRWTIGLERWVADY